MEHYPEAIIEADPDVIMMSCYGDSDADKLQQATGIPVVLVPGSDKMMDEGPARRFVSWVKYMENKNGQKN